MLYLLWNVNFFCSLHFQMQLPWKSLKSIVEYYYMWKTTDRYVQQVSGYLFAVFCCFSLFCLALKKIFLKIVNELKHCVVMYNKKILCC